MFLDIFPILRDPLAFEALITHFMHHITSHTLGLSDHHKIDVVVGLDARGFLLGPIIALRLGAAFVPVRKKGKLPGECVDAEYVKEYGKVSRQILSVASRLIIYSLKDTFEMQADAIKPGQNVIVIDDLIATGTFVSSTNPNSQLTLVKGGSARAAGELVKKQGGKTLEYLFIIELLFLKASSTLDAPSYSIVQAED